MKYALQRYFASFQHPWAIAGETLLLPLFAVTLGIWINPLDPLWTHEEFPWAWLAPVLLAMRYGPFPGLAGALVLLVSWIIFHFSGWLPGDFPKINFLGGLILVMLSGEFSSLWLARARRAESVHVYLDQRLEYLTHQYYLLRLSHDRLEQDLIGQPMAMRDALGTLRNLTGTETDTRQLPGADGLLRLFAQFCQLEAAALYSATADRIDPSPVAMLGQLSGDGHLDLADPLVEHALDAQCLSHVAHNTGSADTTSRYVIVAPLVTFNGERLGLLAVERLPFFALHDEMLQTLNLLIGYYTDGLVKQQLAADIRTAIPSCPTEFAAELQRLSHVRNLSQVNSVIVALEFRPQPGHEDLSLLIRRQRRSLDVNWLIEDAGHRLLITLMPLAGEAAAEGYIARIDEWVRQSSGGTLAQAGVFPHIRLLDNQLPTAVLRSLLETCHVSSDARTIRTDL